MQHAVVVPLAVPDALAGHIVYGERRHDDQKAVWLGDLGGVVRGLGKSVSALLHGFGQGQTKGHLARLFERPGVIDRFAEGPSPGVDGADIDFVALEHGPKHPELACLGERFAGQHLLDDLGRTRRAGAFGNRIS